MFKKVLFVLSLAAMCMGDPDIKARNSSTTLTCGNPADAVPFYRSWIPSWTDHYYTTSAAAIGGGMKSGVTQSEGEAAYIFTTQVEGTVPLYEFFINSWLDHLYRLQNVSSSPGDEVLSGIVGYVYPGPVCGSIPLYELFSSAATDHFYTTIPAERDNFLAYAGYAAYGIAAYVLPAGAAVCN